MADDLPQRDDKELIAACLRGDDDAWEALIVRYQRLIYSIPIKMGLSPNDAADVFQVVCLKMLEKLSTLRNHDRLISWIAVTTKRESWRIAALKRREHIAMPLEWGDGSEEGIQFISETPPVDLEQELIEQQHIVRQAVMALPDRCRKLISMLFYGENLSYIEIAKRLNIPRDSMGPTRARCLAKLRRMLEGKI